ncbi:PDZ domain-containing protein [Nitriliruptoraceae bacterium ZYF776]|nr:PDZ domain-containing protein [Profundirhabdus halotolerans]
MSGRTDEPAAPAEPEVVPTGRRRRYGRPAFYGLSAAIVGWAMAVTPLPYVELVPGTPSAIPPLIEVSGTETTPIDGETTLLTIFLRDVTPWRWLGAQLDGDRELRDVSEFVPGGDLTDDFFAQERQNFARQFQVATAVGAEAAGVEVSLTTAVLVANVLAESPAAGELLPGDRILAYDGAPIATGEELQALTRAGEAGQEVTIRVAHGGQERDVEVVLDTIGNTDTVALGVQVETVADGLDLPFEVALGDTRIGGPSAGLMMALTVYDLLSEEDLVAGRTIAGTGTIDAEGRVGRVGGVAEKMVAAAEHGADLVLVPSDQLEDAMSTAPPGLAVVPVDTFDQALELLRAGRDP